MHDINPLLEHRTTCDSAILKIDDDHFEAFAMTPTGNHVLGVFPSHAEAQQAINDFKTRSAWELKGVRETAPNEFKAIVRGPRGNYTVGTFTSEEEARQAINDVLEARWHG